MWRMSVRCACRCSSSCCFCCGVRCSVCRGDGAREPVDGRLRWAGCHRAPCAGHQHGGTRRTRHAKQGRPSAATAAPPDLLPNARRLAVLPLPHVNGVQPLLARRGAARGAVLSNLGLIPLLQHVDHIHPLCARLAVQVEQRSQHGSTALQCISTHETCPVGHHPHSAIFYRNGRE